MSRGDSFGENLSALKYARDRNITSLPMWGNKAPKYITGAYYLPVGYAQRDAAITCTATRCSYVPLIIWENRTFSGVSVYNTSAADTGKKIRIMVFRDDLSTGGPGTLEKDFGEITLTAAAALRTLSSSWAAVTGVYWLAFWSDSATNVEGMAPFDFQSIVGYSLSPSISCFVGSLNAPVTGDTGNLHTFSHYVDTAYGAAPSTAVAPTASYAYRVNTTAAVGATPAVWLKG